MRCPYCGKETVKGVLSGDGRAPVVFAAEGAPKQGLFDRLADRVTGEGRLTAAEYSLSRFRIGAEYCAACKKMIVDTEVQG